jgi:hypothetical protein
VKPYEIRIPTRQDWKRPEKIIDHIVDLWFTGGSGIHDCFGAGIYGPLRNYRESIPMGSLSTVFSAKVMAILRYTELLLTKNLTRRRIHICSDSRAALAALAKTTTKSSLVWECIQVLEKLSKFNSHRDTPCLVEPNELLAMNKLRLRAAVGLLTGHTRLRSHVHKLGHTGRQECRLCGYEKEDSVHIVCDCPVLPCKRYRILGYTFLKPEDLKKVRVSSLLSLVANTGLGLIS